MHAERQKDLRRADPRKPKISKGELRAITATTIKDDDLFENFAMKEADLAHKEALDARFLSGTIQRSHFEESKLTQVTLADITIENSYFSNADWEKSRFLDAQIQNSKLTGFQSIQSKWNDVLIKESKADLSVFILTKFKNVVFDDCVLNDADFQERGFENVRFYKCELTNASFQGARFKNVDLRGSELEGVKMSPDQFGGLIIEPFQATYLIGATGAKVKWLDEERSEHSEN